MRSSLLVVAGSLLNRGKGGRGRGLVSGLQGVLPKGRRRPERPRIVVFLLAEAGDCVEFLPIREIMSPNWGLGNTPFTSHFSGPMWSIQWASADARRRRWRSRMLDTRLSLGGSWPAHRRLLIRYPPFVVQAQPRPCP